jgi:hypothetical protein
LEPSDRKKLEELALQRLMATADDANDPWSFLYRTEGSNNVGYCSWDAGDSAMFDRDLEGLDLPWTPERLDLIKRGEAEPTQEEARQWVEAHCRKMLMNDDEAIESAYIVPLWIDGKIAAYALFLSGDSDYPYDAPAFRGVFETVEEAKAAVAPDGLIEGAPPSWE